MFIYDDVESKLSVTVVEKTIMAAQTETTYKYKEYIDGVRVLTDNSILWPEDSDYIQQIKRK
jgi:hypothetical protein